MMFRYMGWTEAADLIVKGMEGAVAAKTVTYDFARLMDGAKEIKCSEFGDAIIDWMDRKPMPAPAAAKAAPKKAVKKVVKKAAPKKAVKKAVKKTAKKTGKKK
jgi:hypothetical protein